MSFCAKSVALMADKRIIGIGGAIIEKRKICKTLRKGKSMEGKMSDKELVVQFFMEGYVNKNYDFILECLSEKYIDHSPAGARSNRDAVNILKAVSNMFGELQISVEDVFSENGMVATRIRYDGVHIGECMGIAATGKRISFEALENFKVADGKIVESWGYWPDKEIEAMLR